MELNHRPIELQSIALPLSYVSRLPSKLQKSARSQHDLPLKKITENAENVCATNMLIKNDALERAPHDTCTSTKMCRDLTRRNNCATASWRRKEIVVKLL